MIIIPHSEIQQGTPEWMDLRLGIPTSSSFSRIIKANGEPSAERQKYLEELAEERLTGRQANPFISSAMKRGKLMEPESRTTYEDEYFCDVEQVAFVYHDERKRFGCSPDGFVTPKIGFETKDAKPSIQKERLDKGILPSDHFHQVHGSIYVCGADGWVFRSYCRGMRALTITVEPDLKFIQKLAVALEVFCDDLDKLTELYRRA